MADHPLKAREGFPLVEEEAQALLARYGSPLYVYREDRLRQTLQTISASIPYPHTRCHFATVTNGNVALLQIVRDAGWGLHANTPGDVVLGLAAGFDPRQMVYSGSNLHRDDLSQVLDWGVGRLNLDGLDQLRLYCEMAGGRGAESLRLGLRLHAPELTGKSRIGVAAEEFPEALALAKRAGLKIEGLHFYRGTGTNATVAFTAVIGPVLEMAQLLPDWSTLDFGGGFGYPYRSDGAAFDWSAFGEAISEAMGRLDRPIHLLIEPGRAAIAASGVLLTTVVSTKWQGERQIVGVDSTIANLAVLAVHGGYRDIASVSNVTPGAPLHPSDVCGNTTYSRDYLARHCLLPSLQRGDLLMIRDVGAYGYAMSSHFLHRPRPAEVLLGQRGARLIRERETHQVLLRGQCFDPEPKP